MPRRVQALRCDDARKGQTDGVRADDLKTA